MSFALNRRHLLGFATAAAVQMGLGPIHAARGATASPLAAIKPGSHTSLGPLKSIDAGLVRVGYAELGPANGPVVILLHGWPYDIHSYADVAPLLADAGYRVIVPYLRGYGTTHFLADDTLRNGQPSCAVPIFPFRMSQKKLKHFRSSRWLPFWVNLKEGYDHFAKARRPPLVLVHEQRYAFIQP